MKLIRKDWPRVREYQKSGNTYFSVDLRRKNHVGPQAKSFSQKSAALEFAADIGLKVAKSGIDSISRFTEDPRITAWKEQAAIYGKTLEEVFNLGLAVCLKERNVKESPFMSGLLTTWIDDKTSNKLKPLRSRTETSLRHMADQFKNDFGDVKMKEIDRARIEKYLQEKDVSNQTRENIRNYLSQFFNWAKRNEYHNANPAEGIEIHVAASTREFFTVDQSITLMERAKKSENLSLVPYFALCLFAGVRPDEAKRLNWKHHIKMETKEIFIPHTISKTKKDRMFIMSENLFQWLTIAEKEKQSLIPANFRRLRDLAMADLGFDWIQDGMRHSFSTYHYAKHKNLEELRHIMGNSKEIIERWYKNVISHTEVEKFWSITPESIEPKPEATKSNRSQRKAKEVAQEPIG